MIASAQQAAKLHKTIFASWFSPGGEIDPTVW
jgi:hypothetical protein